MLEKPVTWLLILFTTVAAFTTRAILSHQDKLFEQSKDLPEILHLIDLAYVDDVDMETLMPHAFQGALEALDPNASYIPPGVEPKSYADQVYRRTGMVLCRQDGYAFVMACAGGSPAAEAGLERGSFIKQINNQRLRKLSYHAFEKMLAELDGPIRLHLAGSEDKDKIISFQPGEFSAPKLEHHPYLDGVHHVKLPTFYEGFEAELAKILAGLKKDNTRILLDLRDNALGGEPELHKLAGLFLPAGKMASWVGSDKVSVPIANTGDGKFADLNLFLLVNTGTSRAAECFAAVAAENGAKLVGFKTLGLGFHYQALPLKSGAYVMIPSRNFVMNSGQALNRKGLEPDLAVRDLEQHEAEDDPFLKKALELIRKTPLPQAG